MSSSTFLFRVENRYTGSTDVLGGGVTADVLLLSYGIAPLDKEPALGMLEVGDFSRSRSTSADGKLTGKFVYWRPVHEDGVVQAGNKTGWHGLRIVRVS